MWQQKGLSRRGKSFQTSDPEDKSAQRNRLVTAKMKVIAEKGWLSEDLKKDEDLTTGFKAHPPNW